VDVRLPADEDRVAVVVEGPRGSTARGRGGAPMRDAAISAATKAAFLMKPLRVSMRVLLAHFTSSPTSFRNVLIRGSCMPISRRGQSSAAQVEIETSRHGREVPDYFTGDRH
jgi:hypothetical protein